MENKLGTLIRDLRNSLNMSQKHLAEGICTQAYISKIEKGNIIPSVEIVSLLSNKLSVTLDFIVEKVRYPNFDHVQELNFQIRRLSHERKYDELYSLIKSEKKHNSLPHIIVYEQLLMWQEGVSTYYVLRNFKKSIAILMDALALTSDVSINTERDVEILTSLGIIYNEEGFHKEAMSYLQIALTKLKKLIVVKDNTLMIKILFNTAKVLTAQKKYEEAIDLCLDALRLCSVTEISYLVGELHLQAGLNYSMVNDWVEARLHLEKSLHAFYLLDRIDNAEEAKKELERMMMNFKQVI